MSSNNVLELQQKAEEYFRGYCRGDSKSDDDITVKRDYLDLVGGNWSDAVIFSRIMHWQPWLLKNNRDSLYRNHDEWKAECGIPASTARKAIKRLETKRLITTTVGHDPDGRNTVFITVNQLEFYKHMSNLEKAHVQSGHVHMSNLDTSSIYTDINNQNSSPASSANSAESSDIEKVKAVSKQVYALELTDKQRDVLMDWLCLNHDGEYAPRPDTLPTRTMNDLVRKGVLASDGNGGYSTSIVDTSCKAVLASLTYGDLNLSANSAGEPREASKKPFWEAAAEMIARNETKNSWVAYHTSATPKEWQAFNGKVKQLLQHFEEWHEDRPIHPHEMQDFVYDQYREWVKDKSMNFATTKEAIDRLFPSFRIKWRQAHPDKAVAA